MASSRQPAAGMAASRPNKQDSALTQPPTEVWREAATRRSSTGHLIRQTDQSES